MDRIRRVEVPDIEDCVQIENSFSSAAPDAAEVGFLRGGANAPLYQTFLNDFFYVAESSGEITGFLIVLKPENERFAALKREPARFRTPGIALLEVPNLHWLAKVAVIRGRLRQGIASSLWRTFLSDNPSAAVATTTAAKPIPNVPSKLFHRALGFECVGEFDVGDGSTYHDLLLRVPAGV
jgi:predicted GNAT superfamily acetyltransferase